MHVTVFFAVDKDGIIRMFFEDPCRNIDMWTSDSDFCLVSSDILPEDDKKEKILNLTWEDEPLKCELYLAIEEFCK